MDEYIHRDVECVLGVIEDVTKSVCGGAAGGDMFDLRVNHPYEGSAVAKDSVVDVAGRKVIARRWEIPDFQVQKRTRAGVKNRDRKCEKFGLGDIQNSSPR